MSRPARRPHGPSAAVVEPLEPRRLLTFYRVTTADDVVAEDGAISLREALEASNGNVAVGDAPAGQADAVDVIRIDPSLRRTDGAARFVGRVDVSDSLVLLASGVTFGGADRERVFDVRLEAGEQFVLDSAIVRDGRGREDFRVTGGGLRFAGPFEDPEAQIGDTAADPTARLGLRGVRFLNNGATGDNFVGGVGGALSTLGGAVVIRDSAFVSNSSDMGGAAAIESFTVRITDTVFQRNSATRGGALSVGDVSTTEGRFPADIRIARTRFLANRANSGFESISSRSFPGSGGALAVGGTAVVVVSDSLFEGNRASGSGGAVDGSGDLQFVRTTFSKNRAEELVDERNESREGGDGGAIRFSGSRLRLGDVLFRGNRADNRGGAVALKRSISFRDPQPPPPTVIAAGVTFSVNVAGAGGGLSAAGGAAVDLRDAVFLQNRAAGRAANGIGEALPGDGGAVLIDNGRVVLSGDSSVRNNTAVGDGGGLFNADGLALENTTVTGNVAGFGGPGIGGGVFTADGALTRLTDPLIEDNRPDDLAGPGRVIRR